MCPIWRLLVRGSFCARLEIVLGLDTMSIRSPSKFEKLFKIEISKIEKELFRKITFFLDQNFF